MFFKRKKYSIKKQLKDIPLQPFPDHYKLHDSVKGHNHLYQPRDAKGRFVKR